MGIFDDLFLLRSFVSIVETGSIPRRRVASDCPSPRSAVMLLAEESEQRMRDEQQTLQGNIRVFATIDFGQCVVSRLIATFIQDDPAVTVRRVRRC
jgi:DNA-binding transcriptional LysR family regulator